jgi:hypothetical protein
VVNSAKNMMLLRMPTGQFHTCWRTTSQTTSTPEANPITSAQLVGAPNRVKAVDFNASSITGSPRSGHPDTTGHRTEHMFE